MRTVEQTADELVEKFIHAQDNTEFETSEENHEKCQSLNEELGTDINVYWERLAIQSAIIALENKYHSLREQLFNLRSCGVIESQQVYTFRLDELIEEEKQVKQELETRLNK